MEDQPSIDGACPIHAGFRPLSDEFLAEPYEEAATVHARGHVVFFAPAIDHYVVAGHSEIQQVMLDAATFSNSGAQSPIQELSAEAESILQGTDRPPRPLTMHDPPHHQRVRGPAARAFTARRVQQLEAKVRALTQEQLDQAGEQFDIVDTLAFPVSARTIFSLLGIPPDDTTDLRHWGSSRTKLSWGRPTPEEQLFIARDLVDYGNYVRRLAEAKLRNPADDLASDLVAIHQADPEQFTFEEVATVLFSLTLAGHETTSNMITNMVRNLLAEHGRWEELVADPSQLPGVIEEMLRFDTSAITVRRVATCDTRLGGVDIPAGSRVLLWLAAGNRDPRVFSEPRSFNPHRPELAEHIAFGRGAHFCLGASLARLELRVVLEELVARFPDLSLVPSQEIRYPANIGFRGPTALWVRQAQQSVQQSEQRACRSLH